MPQCCEPPHLQPGCIVELVSFAAPKNDGGTEGMRLYEEQLTQCKVQGADKDAGMTSEATPASFVHRRSISSRSNAFCGCGCFGSNT